MTSTAAPSSVLAIARQIGRDVAGPAALDVDKNARFPSESIDALRAEGLLGALIPVDHGGLGHDLADAATVVRELARHCASSAMVLAMHHIQVACLVRHGGTPDIDAFVQKVAAEQLLLASATTEIGIGGDTRTSTCAVEEEGEEFTLIKQAPVISYGEYSDAILVTARRTPDSPANDQVLVVVDTPTTELIPLSGWDTFGFRGTCSSGFKLTAHGSRSRICADLFEQISAETMLPTAHLLWSSLWLGLADEATSRAQRFVQKAARRDLSTQPPGAARLAGLLVTRQQLASSVHALLTRYLAAEEESLDETGSIDFMVEVNALKVSASTLVVDIIGQALLICGIAGYREDSEFTLGRLLRDAHGAAVMVNNDRIAGNTARLALMQREASV